MSEAAATIVNQTIVTARIVQRRAAGVIVNQTEARATLRAKGNAVFALSQRGVVCSRVVASTAYTNDAALYLRGEDGSILRGEDGQPLEVEN